MKIGWNGDYVGKMKCLQVDFRKHLKSKKEITEEIFWENTQIASP